MPRAFITGITGQDGQHLAEFLHNKGYEVFGLVKGQNNPRMDLLRDEFPFVQPVPGDLADLPSLVKALDTAQPDEVYNLGAMTTRSEFSNSTSPINVADSAPSKATSLIASE